ncbi:MAG: tetratricopeptide repeat protein [Bacteroidia bacterium]|nr:tetratricopeptide repeat protein [Bacteroidia bacterium]
MRKFTFNSYQKRKPDYFRNFRLLLFFCILGLAQSKWANAQRTAVYEEDQRYYQRGLELFDKEKYAAAQKHFLWFESFTKDPQLKINARYYAATSGMELFNPDAEKMLLGIIQAYPENPKAKLAAYQLGRFHYRNKNNKEAVKWLNQVSPDYLSNAESKEYYFTKGYCHFKINEFKESQAAFKFTKDEKSKFYDASNYYYAYVCYQSGDFNEALEHFNRIKYHKTFGPLSSVYVAQIYFSRKQYQEVVNYCDTITNKELAVDVAGMLGQSYFHLKNYNKAIPYLESFMKEAPVLPKNSDYYQLAYSYYKSERYQDAIQNLLKIESPNDTIKQSYLFILADCYLRTNQKASAIQAFDQCYAAGPLTEAGELALLNTAKLSDELNLQGNAMSAYAKFIDQFPKSSKLDEVRSNLSNLLLHARNFKEAIKILESISNPGKPEKVMLQRVMYYRAEELYLNSLFAEASDLFARSGTMNLDPYYTGLSWFWIGELAYKNGKYAEALTWYQKARTINEFKTTRFYPLSWYESAYSQLKLEQYDIAIEAYKEYIKLDPSRSNPEIFTDALIRVADCYFISRRYEQAIEYYDKVVSYDLNGGDYALYQKSLILGVQNKYTQKGEVLKKLIQSYPKSIYIDDAVYENANLLLLSEDFPGAIREFESLIKNYPRSQYIRKARLSKALSLFNNQQDEESLKELKILITENPGSDEAKDGLMLVKNILVNKGESEKYLEFVKVLPNIIVSASTQDSLSYEAAFNLYKAKETAKAAKSFANYMSKFPGGYFILKANYFRAECEYKLKNYDAALPCYEFVADGLRSDFSEWSTRQAAVIHYMKKNYDNAYTYYAALERIASNKDNMMVSLLGQMRSSNIQGKTDSATTAAIKYLNSGLAQKEPGLEARILVGRHYLNRGKLDSAQHEFVSILKETKNIIGAEAKYHLAWIHYQRKDYKSAQKACLELADLFSSFDYWVAKGYILTADCLVKQNDFFQAKATLQSLIDNYEGAEIPQLATTKLNEVIELEKLQKDKQKDEVEQRIKKKENK